MASCFCSGRCGGKGCGTKEGQEYMLQKGLEEAAAGKTVWRTFEQYADDFDGSWEDQ